MRDDTWWAAAHVLATLSHVVLGLAGAVYFVAISPFPGDGGPQFGDRFEYIRKFWLAIPMVSARMMITCLADLDNILIQYGNPGYARSNDERRLFQTAA